MKKISHLIIIIVISTQTVAVSRSYKHAKVYYIDAGDDQNEILRQFNEKIDFWTSLEMKGKTIGVLVEPEVIQALNGYLEEASIHYTVRQNYTDDSKKLLYELPPRTNLSTLLSSFGRKLDFWTPLRKENIPITFLVFEKQKMPFTEFLRKHNIEFETDTRTTSFRLKPPINMLNVLQKDKILEFTMMLREDDDPAIIESYDMKSTEVLAEVLSRSVVPHSIQTLDHPGISKFEIEPSPYLRDIGRLYGGYIDFWTPFNEQGSFTKFLVDHQVQSSFIRYLKNNNMEYTSVVRGDGGYLEFRFEPGFNFSEVMNVFGASLDFWTPMIKDGEPIILLVKPEVVANFTEFLKKNKVFFNRIDTFEVSARRTTVFYIYLKYLPQSVLGPIFHAMREIDHIKYDETEPVELTYKFDLGKEVSSIFRSLGVWYSVEEWPTEYRVKTKLDCRHQIREIGKLFGNKVSIWGPRFKNDQKMKVMVLPDAVTHFTNYLQLHKIQYKEIIPDVDTVLQRHSVGLELYSSKKEGLTFTQYERHDNIVDYLYDLAVKYPDLVTIDIIGLSTESREIVVVKLSTVMDDVENKPIILVDAGIHGREWIGPATALYIINQLVEVPENRRFIQNVDWYIIPILNPDGYEYSHYKDRLWKKNRKRFKNSKCVGVDLNRNFGYQWSASSENKCSETYPGPKPFSEIEIVHFKNFVRFYAKRIKLYISLHSYGSLILYPWGYSHNSPSDVEELQTLGERISETISYYNPESKYKVGRLSEILYRATGSSVDWMKGEMGVNLSYVIEIYDGGALEEFEPAPEDIISCARDIFAGMKSFYYHVESKYLYRDGDDMKVYEEIKEPSTSPPTKKPPPSDKENNRSIDFDVWSSWFD